MKWRPMGVGDLLDAAFRGYRRFFIPCLVAYLLFCLPGVAGQAAMTAITTLLPEISMNAALLALTVTIPLTILTSLLVGLAEAVCANAVLTGFKGGSVIGSSDAKGEFPKTRPTYPWDLVASIYRLMGIDPVGKLPHPQGCVAYLTPLATGSVPTGGLLNEIM